MSDIIQPVPDPQPGKPRGHKRRWLIFLGILLLVLALLIWFLLSNSTALDGVKRTLRYLGNRDGDYGRVSFETFGRCAYSQVGDGLAVGTQGGVTLFAPDGKIVGRIQRNLTTPALLGRDDALLAYDIGGTLLAVMDDSGAVRMEKKTAGRIFDADLSTKGYSAVLSEGEDCRTTLEVYDPHGTLLYRRNSKTHYLNCCALSQNGAYAVAAAMGQEQIAFSTTAQVYRTDKEEIAAEIPLGNQVIYDMAFVDANTICAVGADRMVFFETDGTVLGEYAPENGELAGYSFGGDGFVTVLVNLYQTGSRYMLATVDAEGAVIASVTTDEAPTAVSACGRYAAVLTARELRIYDSNLEVSNVTENMDGFVNALVRSDGTALLIGAGSAEVYIP